MLRKTIVGIIFVIQCVCLSQVKSQVPEKNPLRFFLIDMGVYNSTSHGQAWGLNDHGDLVGFHKKLVLPDTRSGGEQDEPPEPPKGGGGLLWIDQNGNRMPDPEYIDEDGNSIKERIDIGVPGNQPGVLVRDIGNSRHVAGLAYDDGFTMHLARWDVEAQEQGDSVLSRELGPESVGWVTINNDGDILDANLVLWPLNGSGIDLAEDIREYLPPEPANEGEPRYALINSYDFNDDRCILFSASKYVDDELEDSFFYTRDKHGNVTCTDLPARGIGLINNRGQMVLVSTEKRTITVPFPDGSTYHVTQDWPSMAFVNPKESLFGDSKEIIYLHKMLSGFDFNDQGCLVGYREEGSGLVKNTIPYIWTRQYGLVDLNELIFRKPQDVTLTHALRINNSGLILALGKKKQGMSSETRIFLLRPRQGIDRWWATAGSAGTLNVNWTVAAPRNSIARTFLSVGQGESWALQEDATASLIPMGLDKTGDPVSLNSFWGTSLDLEEGGLFVIHISGFAVPNQPAIESIPFYYGYGEFEAPLHAYFVADVSGPGLDTDYRALAHHYAPDLYFHSLERFAFPVGIEGTWGSPTLSFSENPSWCQGLPFWGFAEQTMDLSRFGITPPPSPNPSCNCEPCQLTPTVYAAFVERGNELAINYYFHYPRSNWWSHGGFNNHEGDWEGITVFLTMHQDGYEPVNIGYSQHVRFKPLYSGGVIIPWEELMGHDSEMSHPPVYVGLGGHASYPCPGTTPWVTPIGSRPEVHDGTNVLMDYEIVILPRVGHLETDNTWDWLLYPGHWGNVDIDVPGMDIGPGDNGPPGPLFLEKETGFGLGLKWFDPWQWRDQLYQLGNCPNSQ